jgi:HK97 gp10 family phage protein
VASSTEVLGLRELGRAMERLGADVAGKVARQATAAGARVVRQAARDKAPIDSGNLAASIVMKRVRQTNLTEEYIVTPRRGKKKDVKLGKHAARNGKAGKNNLAGKDAFYARFVEFGTVKMPAHPFMRPALENNIPAATQAMADRLRARLKKVGAL